MTAPLAEIWKVRPVVDDYLALRAAIPMVREQIEMMLELLATRETPVGRFLDLDCGDGILGAAVLERFPDSRGVLLDFSEPMLSQARNLLRGFDDRAEFLLADYARADWADTLRDGPPFDAIVSGYSIHHQPDGRKRELYAEILGLLGPGGWFINIDPAASITTRVFQQRFVDHEYAEETRRGGGRTRQQVAAWLQSRPDSAANILAPVETQCDWLRQAGFDEVDCYFKFCELAVFGGRRPPTA